MKAEDTIDMDKVIEVRKRAKAIRGRLLAIFLFILFLVFFFIYGFQSRFYKFPQHETAQYKIPLLLMSTFFVVVGFGLLLSSFKYSKLSGMAISIFVVSLNYLIGPLLQQLWFIAFLSWLTGDVTVIAPNAEQYWLTGSQSAVSPSELSFKLANLCSVSFLIALTGKIGRVTLQGVFMSNIIFSLLWYLNITINILLSQERNPESLVYFDDFGTNFVYLYGAIFGLFLCIMNKSKRKPEQEQVNQLSTLYTLIGAGCLFCTFAFMTTDIISLTGTSATFRFNAEPANIWFSMISGIAGVYIGSILFNKSKVGLRETVIGTIVGAIITGAGAGYIENIGASLGLGLFAGFFTAILMNTLVKSLNKDNIVDSQGFIIPVLITSFLGGFVVLPSIIIRYYTIENTYFSLGGLSESEWQAAGFQLAYVGVTVLVAIVAGLIGGGLLIITQQPYTDFFDFKFFSDDYGLFHENDESFIFKSETKITKDFKPEKKDTEEKKDPQEKDESQKQLKPDVI